MDNAAANYVCIHIHVVFGMTKAFSLSEKVHPYKEQNRKEREFPNTNTQHTSPSSSHPNQHTPMNPVGIKTSFSHHNTNRKTTQTKKQVTPTTHTWDEKTLNNPSPQRNKNIKKMERFFAN